MLKRYVIERTKGRGLTLSSRADRGLLVHSLGVVVDTSDARFIYCSGMTATMDQSDRPEDWRRITSAGDVAGQTRQVLTNLGELLDVAGATFDDVVRMRVFVAQARNDEVISQIRHVRAERFGGGVFPASTFVFVEGLVPEDALIEIDCDAVVPT